MGNRRLKFAGSIAILAAAVIWLGMSGYEEGKAYYKTADEFVKLDRKDQGKRIRLMGNVAKGSIQREGSALAFAVTLNGVTVPVVYRGTDPVPDTFKDGAQALIDGSMGDDGRFAARQIQAKCASKYEADPKTAFNRGYTSGSPEAK